MKKSSDVSKHNITLNHRTCFYFRAMDMDMVATTTHMHPTGEYNNPFYRPYNHGFYIANNRVVHVSFKKTRGQ